LEQFKKFCEKYEVVGYLIAYPILISTIEIQLGSASKFNLVSIMTDWFGWIPALVISIFASIVAGVHFVGFIWGKFNQ